MSRCPECDLEVNNVWAEVAHMNDKHPEVVEKRLRESGFVPDGKGGWIDTLADPDS